MYQSTCFKSAVVACLLAVGADVALADVYACAGPGRAVTFTDIRCMAGEDAIKVAVPGGRTQFKAQAAVPVGKVVLTKFQYLRSPGEVATSRMLSTDVATMKAAKDGSASFDRLSALAPRPAFSTSY